MRWSLRRAAKASVLILAIFCTSFLLIKDFDFNSEDGKLTFESFIKKNGRLENLKPVDSVRLPEFYRSHLKRKQRSAKSLTEDVEEFKYQKRKVTSPILEKVSLVKNTTTHRTDLSDIFIGVKTSKRFHDSRLKVLLETWVELVKQQTYIFTDEDDPSIQGLLPEGHLVNTNCSSGHTRKALCCKMSVEYDYYITSGKRWFCHVDDDNYINIPQLLHILRQYDHKKDWYLGKPSLQRPIEIMDKGNPEQKLAFWFATGGAGFCISSGLALKMMPHAGGGRFMTTANYIRLPDDCTIGYIINHLLKTKLTVHDGFHSHLEPLSRIRDIGKQITFSHTETNIVNVPAAKFIRSRDKSRFKSIHCHLFPNFKMCTSPVR